MPDWLQVILLGVVEGITEFLPVSSTGHLLLAEPWQGAREDHFTICIQSGAVLAVLAVFRERVSELIEKRREPETQDYLKKLCFSFVLTGFGGLALKAAGWELPKESAPIGWALLIGGLAVLWGASNAVTALAVTGLVLTIIPLAIWPGFLRSSVDPGESSAGIVTEGER